MLPLQFRHPGPPFPTLLRPVGHPKTALNFGWSVGRSVFWSVGRSWGSHINVMLPLQFLHPGLPFPILLRPVGHPQNGLKFWWVGGSVGHGKVTQTSHCLFSFVTRAHPSRPFYALRATPKTVLNFGRSVGWLVGRSVGWSVTEKSNECHAASSVLSPGPALTNPSTPCRPPPKRP
jgi:hypothetical protein